MIFKVLVVLTFVSLANSRCPTFPLNTWVEIVGYGCYHFGTTTMDWMDATGHCKKLGGHLVEITNTEEHNLIKTFGRLLGARSYWIGLDDLGHEGYFTWTRSGQFNTFNARWMLGQPNDRTTTASPYGEQCTCMTGYDLLWTDENCKNKLYPLCETDEFTF